MYCRVGKIALGTPYSVYQLIKAIELKLEHLGFFLALLRNNLLLGQTGEIVPGDSRKQTSCFQANSGNAKRQKVSHPNYLVYQKQGIRRSTRHRKVRGERALLVSANQTLKDLKIQVRQTCSRYSSTPSAVRRRSPCTANTPLSPFLLGLLPEKARKVSQSWEKAALGPPVEKGKGGGGWEGPWDSVVPGWGGG